MTLSHGKRQRMAQAAKLKYGERKTHKEIADELELSKSTIDNYFSDDQMEQFKRIFSDKEKFELQRIIEQQLYDVEKEAKEKIRQGAQHPDASPADRIRAGKELMNTMRRKVNLLQEIGVIEKPKERKEVEEKNGDEEELAERLQEAYQELEVEDDASE